MLFKMKNSSSEMKRSTDIKKRGSEQRTEDSAVKYE